MFSSSHFDPRKILGVKSDSTQADIKKAYRNQALLHHPDKKGGNKEKFDELHRAYEILTNPIERKKWEESKSSEEKSENVDDLFELKTTTQRPSVPFQQYFSAMEKHFKNSPLQVISPKKREEAFIIEEKSKREYYKKIYRATEDDLDIFQFIAHQTKTSPIVPTFTAHFFEEKLSPKKAIDILLDFLQGNCYGDKLTITQDYLQQQTSLLYQINNPDVTLFKAIISLITTKDSKAEYNKLLQAIENIYLSFYQRRETNSEDLVRLMESKYFRYFVSSILKHFWQNKTPQVTNNLLHDLKSAYSELKTVLPLGATLYRIEKQMQKIFETSPSLKTIYDCGYLLIDLMHTAVTSAASINSALLAGLCFQLAAKQETSAPERAMTAERLSLILYQQALERAFKSNVLLSLYASTHAAKYLFELTYEQSTLSLDINTAIMQPGDAAIVLSYSGSVLATFQNAMERVLYLTDTLPFYTSLKTTLDLEVIKIHQTGLLRDLLQYLLSKRITNHIQSNVVYHAYENAIQEYVLEENRIQQQDKIIKLRLESIESLLKEEKQTLNDMAELIDTPYIHMRRDQEGWFLPENKLDFPLEVKIPVYKSFNGFEINRDTGEIRFIYTEWKPTDSPLERLFTEYDIYQMLSLGIDGGYLSLDHLDSKKNYHPLQKVCFSPASLEKTEFLKTLFMTDYLLKMFTTGSEVSAHPPYLTRSTEKLIARLPDKLKKILNLCANQESNSGHAHRFWLTTDKIEYKEETNDKETKVYFGKAKVKINHRLLTLNEKGDLVDAKNTDDDKSIEAQFARELTEAYEELGDYFPEFRRFQRLMEVVAAINRLKQIREINQLEIKRHTEVLGDSKLFDKVYTDTLSKKTLQLTKVPMSFPKFTWQLHDPEILKSYNELYAENYQRIKQQIYNELYQTNKTSITAKHGAVVFSQHEAQLSKDLDTAAATEAKNYLSTHLTQQSVLSQYNQQGQQRRAEIKKEYHTVFLDFKSNTSDTEFNSMVEAFMNGNVDPIAKAIANHAVLMNKLSVNESLAKKQKLENYFNRLQFDSITHNEKESVSLRVPAVFNVSENNNYRRYVYGGNFAYPTLMKVSELSSQLKSPFEFQKERAIQNAEKFIQDYKSSCIMMPFTVTHWWSTARERISRLEDDITKAKYDLFWMEIRSHSAKVNHGFSKRYDEIFKNTFDSIEKSYQAQPLWKNDPFLLPRLESSLNQQKHAMSELRTSIKTGVESVLQYADAMRRGAVKGLEDLDAFIQDPLGGLEPIGHALFDLTIIACAHLPLATDTMHFITDYDDVMTMKAIIQSNPGLYETATKNMQDRLINIKEGLNQFVEAKPVEKTEMATRAAVNIVLPSFFLKSAKYASISSGATRLAEKPVYPSFFSPKSLEKKLTITEITGCISGEKSFFEKMRLIRESDYLSPTHIPPYIAETFTGKRYTTYKLTEPVILYRAGAKGKPLGQFFSFEKPVSELQVRMDKAIKPVWPDGQTSIVDTGYGVKIPAGTIIHVGEIGSQVAPFLGGTKQIFIEKPWLIHNITVVEEYALKEELLWNSVARMRK